MFDEKVYRRMNERIVPDEALVVRTREAVRQRASKRVRPVGAHALRRVAAFAALTFCLLFAAPALAVSFPAGYRIMYAISPAVAQFFVPVQKSCESDGIRMEVLSTYVHGDTMEFYITMQDLTGDRIDASMDLYDSYGINLPFDDMGTCRQVDYDPDTKTATFWGQVTTMDGRDIPGGKVTFSVTCFLSGKRIIEDEPLAMDWSKAEGAPETLTLNEPSGGYTMLNPITGEYSVSPVYARVLKPMEPIAILEEGFTVTGMGYISGRLHIQLYTPGRREYDDHAFLDMTDAQGNELHGDMVYHDFIDEQTGSHVDYIDYVFDVPKASLPDCELTGSFYAAKMRTDGSWQVTFPLMTDTAGQS